jgi:hypothetical protein
MSVIRIGKRNLFRLWLIRCTNPTNPSSQGHLPEHYTSEFLAFYIPLKTKCCLVAFPFTNPYTILRVLVILENCFILNIRGKVHAVTLVGSEKINE